MKYLYFKLILICAYVILVSACDNNPLKSDSSSSFRYSSNVQNSSSSTLSISSSESSTSKEYSSSSIKCLNLYGENRITDCRDGLSYETTKIGTQIWLAENLRYAPKGSDSKCYCSEAKNCEIYGRLYSWNYAVNRSLDEITTEESVYEITQGICPYGWHIPNVYDWRLLINFVGGDSIAGHELKLYGWQINMGEKNAYGFSALPGGRVSDGGCFSGGINGFWWSSTMIDSAQAFSVAIKTASDFIYAKIGYKTDYSSLRCIKDDESIIIRSSSSTTPVSSSIADECYTDEQCPVGYICKDKYCLAKGYTCSSDYDCGSQMMCISGNCYDNPYYCSTDAQCGTGMMCLNGICYDRPY